MTIELVSLLIGLVVGAIGMLFLIGCYAYPSLKRSWEEEYERRRKIVLRYRNEAIYEMSLADYDHVARLSGRPVSDKIEIDLPARVDLLITPGR